MRALLIAAVVWFATLGFAHAHALDPGYLSLERLDGDNWRILWSKPDVGGAPMAIDAQLPENCDRRRGPDPHRSDAIWSTSWFAKCPGGIAGRHIEIIGLEATRTDVLVRWRDETVSSQRLTAAVPSFTVPVEPGPFQVLRTYVELGFEHILEGYDHLLFVLALILLVDGYWRLLGAVTAFTLAHSVTLAASTLGWVALRPEPVETAIALSILFLAAEIARGRTSGTPTLSARYPWMVCFAFGLLHGFGFAGALREIGLPPTDTPLALLAFNLGVEAGQVCFILVVAVGLALGRWVARALSISGGRLVTMRLLTYPIGIMAAFWFWERVTSF